MTRLSQWFLSFQNSYVLLHGASMRESPGNYSEFAELVLIMMGAGVAASALPRRRTGESTSERSPQAAPRSASIVRFLRRAVAFSRTPVVHLDADDNGLDFARSRKVSDGAR